MVQQLKVSVLTAAVSSASMGQPSGLNYAVAVPVIAAVLRFLSEIIWRSLPETWRHPYRPERHYMRGPGPKWREKHAPSYLIEA